MRQIFLNRASFRILHAIRADARPYVSLHPTESYPVGLAAAAAVARPHLGRALASLAAPGLLRQYAGREAWKLTDAGEAVYQLNLDRVGRVVRAEERAREQQGG